MSVIDRTVDQLAYVKAQLSEAQTLEEVAPLYLKKLRLLGAIRDMEDQLNKLSRGWVILPPKRMSTRVRRQPVTSAK